ncbi:hypothetical protein ACFPYI_15115 [Halomarina salina]|uniref:Integral membrane protein n=1 Tax=Halomarina salina TaxID=1872699 RepID=A0ABD5RQ40_9EURY|nr:hypothetical protein [Halomarina salina]
MQVSSLLVSAGLMGVVLVAVVAAVVGLRDWRSDDDRPEAEATSLGERAEGLLRSGMSSQLVWILGFLVLSFGLGGAVVLFLAGGPMSAMAAIAGVVLGVLVLLVFLSVGTYRTVRFRGRTSASAAAVTAWTLGLLFLVAVTVNLVVS